MKTIISILIILLSVISVNAQTYPITKRSALLNEGSIKIGSKEILIKNEYEDIKINIPTKVLKDYLVGLRE